MVKRCQKRTLGKPIGNANRAPSPKRLVWVLLREPEDLEKAERGTLDEMLEASTDIAAIYSLIQRFEKMIKNTGSDGQRRTRPIASAATSGESGHLLHGAVS
jgi:hypothetical protein